MRYTPSGSVQDPVLAAELLQISRAIENLNARIYTKLYAEPDKPQDGMVVFADGTTWDPGSGEGLYRYDASGTSWVYLETGGGGGGVLTEVVDDPSPQLGGDLDMNGFDIFESGSYWLKTEGSVFFGNAAFDTFFQVNSTGVAVLEGRFFNVVSPNGSYKAQSNHDNTDYNTNITGVAPDWNITGINALNVVNYNFDVDQTVGVGQDDYVLTYDNATGEISLEQVLITQSQITNLSIETADLALGAVTADVLADLAVLEEKLAANAVTLAKLDTADFRPVQLVATLPVLPDATYPIDSIVLLSTDSKIYRNDANVWTTAVATADLSGTIDLDTQISGTLSTSFAEAGLINSNVTINADGTLSGAGGGTPLLQSLGGALNLDTQVSGTLSTAFAEAGLINTGVTINANGTLSGAGGGQASLASLPGQISAGQIVANTITAGQIAALTITASEIAALTITGAKIAANTIEAGQIAANTITAAEIAALTITASQIAANTITAGQIAANTIDTGQLAAGAVTANEIAANTITGGQIAANAIDTDELNANAVTAAKIAANTITANEIFAGTITANELTGSSLSALYANLGSITSGTITLNSTGHIKSGQTAYNTGTGFWLGRDGATGKFSIGDGSANRLTWDGSTLTVRGDLSIGSYTASTTEVLLAANTERSASTASYSEVKKFEINKPGTVRVYFEGRMQSITGGVVTAGMIRVKLDGVVQGSVQNFTTTTYASRNIQVTTTESSQFITIEYKDGERNTSEPVFTNTYIRNAQVRATIDWGEAVITD